MRKLKMHIKLLFAFVGLFTIGCAHGSVVADQTAGAQAATVPVSAVLGEGDVIELKVFDEPDLSGDYQVSAGGVIRLPLVGTLKIADLSVEDAGKAITQAYQAGYLKKPQVTLFVKAFNSRKIFVIGEVRLPGPFPFEEKMTVIGAIAHAGGTTSLAAPNRTVVSRVQEGKQVRQVVAVADIGKGEAPDVDLHPGDIIFVPESLF